MRARSLFESGKVFIFSFSLPVLLLKGLTGLTAEIVSCRGTREQQSDDELIGKDSNTIFSLKSGSLFDRSGFPQCSSAANISLL